MDRKRTIYITIAIAISLLSSFYGAPYIDQSASAISSIIDIYAILAAVLVAVISIIGDPAMLIPGGWRVGHVHAQQIQRRIGRFSHLFLLYILTLMFAVISIVAKDNQLIYRHILYYLLTFLASFSFILSLPLPYTLMKIQKDRMDEIVRKRKLDHMQD